MSRVKGITTSRLFKLQEPSASEWMSLSQACAIVDTVRADVDTIDVFVPAPRQVARATSVEQPSRSLLNGIVNCVTYP